MDSSAKINVAAKEDGAVSDVDEERTSTEAIHTDEEKRNNNDTKGQREYYEKKTKKIIANRHFARASYQRRVRKLAVLQARQRDLSQRNHELLAQNKQLRLQAQELRHQLCGPQPASFRGGGLLDFSSLGVAGRGAQSLQVGPPSSLTPNVISGVHHQHTFPVNSIPTLTQATNLSLLTQPSSILIQNELEDELTLELQRTLLLEQCLARLRR